MVEDISGKMEVEKVISYSDDLVKLLKSPKDFTNLMQCSDQSVSLHSQCHSHFNHLHTSIQNFQKKIDMCKQKTDEANSLVAEDGEMNLLQKELEEELQRERVLREELRVINNEIGDLERQRVSIEERRQTLNKIEQDDLRAQMKLSMYASVTNIIPNLDDQSKISGHIVEREKKVVEKFEIDPVETSVYDACNNVWKMINLW